eukprot:scaffold1561_cov42-Phaeocystis_antarctica.AAC.2
MVLRWSDGVSTAALRAAAVASRRTAAHARIEASEVVVEVSSCGTNDGATASASPLLPLL